MKIKKIVNIIGGLGNQMFQYAFALALQKKYPECKVKINTLSFKGYKLHNGFELAKVFSVKLEETESRDLWRIGYPAITSNLDKILRHLYPTGRSIYKEKKSMVYDPNALEKDGVKFYDGYWQSEKYFKEVRKEILDAFVFPPFEDSRNIDLSKEISNNCSVSIHVRRGDYLKSKYFRGIGTKEYYKRAISLIKDKTNVSLFVVFSNDIEWCRDNLKGDFGDVRVIYVDWNQGRQSYRDTQLMSLCRHNIVANSSFSWWGAWLNQHKDKIVISPSRWKNVPYNLDIIPDDWVKIEVD